MNRGYARFTRLPPSVNCRPYFLRSASEGAFAGRLCGEEGGTHGTVADGTKGHKRQRDTLAVLCTRRTLAHAGGARICARATQRVRLCDSWRAAKPQVLSFVRFAYWSSKFGVGS